MLTVQEIVDVLGEDEAARFLLGRRVVGHDDTIVPIRLSHISLAELYHDDRVIVPASGWKQRGADLWTCDVIDVTLLDLLALTDDDADPR